MTFICVGFAMTGASASEAIAEDVPLSVSIITPSAVEMSAWTELRLKIDNLGEAAVEADVALTLPVARARTAESSGGTCVGSLGTVDCRVSLPEGATSSLAFPVQWNGPGRRTVDAHARLVSSPPTAGDVQATSIVSVYLLALQGLRTSPSPARAGRNLVATATLVRSDTISSLRARSLRCLAAIAAVPRGQALAFLRGEPLRRGAHLRCSWLLPSDARGQIVRMLVLADTHRGGMTTKYPFWRAVH
jgi:hypothetical protein